MAHPMNDRPNISGGSVTYVLRDRLLDKPDADLKTGRGGGNDGGMEQRISRLEEDVKEIKTDLKALRSDVSELKGRVSMLPGYGGIALIVGLIVALSTAAQIGAKFIP